jgi:hypothetical protein
MRRTEMKIDSAALEYLTGKSFSNSFKFHLPQEKISPESRENVIVRIIKDTKVIHMGCADHINLIDSKISSGKWLHGLITEEASKSIGIDINPDSTEYIRKLGYDNVLTADILNDEIKELSDNNWDWVVFGELIEHIGNPVEFLYAFRMKYGQSVRKFLISVPTVYTTGQYRNMKNYCEIINTDHRFWFTPYTICKVLTEAGLKPEEISFTNLQSLNITQLTLRKLLHITGSVKKYPFWCYNTIIVTGAINQEQ